MLDPEHAALERRTRRRWLGIIVGFFVLQAMLWSYTLARVSGDPSHAVVEDYDQRAIDWDKHRAQMAASAALGWAAKVDVTPRGLGGEGGVRVTLTDAAHRPVLAENVVATVFHQAAAARRTEADLEPLAPGVYTARLPIDRPGKWRVRIEARRGEDVFETTSTQVVPAAQEPR